MIRAFWRPALAGAALSVLAATAVAAQPAAQEDARAEAAWTELRPNVTGDRPIQDGAGVLSLDTPRRAEDAAIVPVGIRIALPEGDGRAVKRLTLVVDENPSPVVGTFTFPTPQHRFELSTRIRVNSYSYVRAIAETEDGALYMTKAYVKAAGGCSAPAVKDPAEAKANLGKMRFRAFAERGEAQVQVRHPNYSGLQMDQVTRLYTPAWFVETLSVRQGETPLFTLTGGISVSEDPTFRFTFAGNGEPVTVVAKDTEGRTFTQSFPASGS
ncbi:Sulphur oxidation protein SoxZ [Methylobacterium sp. 4-46]|uniref:quinoprotein dehydrogenase-associated SoxYZ-like carrier n=1 Tax=unclassified Methylobacterium TaxID=2615210 RepID=UPI000152DAA7|nr:MULTISPECIES: quinoprotein dehydrogenase-associated SoxYZ-like carrier [Methylobacterium]ACA20047.1 Sulphur oxidation protein SoxZ [Methylobacterium sp. 4-46]WFT79234.1 quinoprotein dehydrogenase-associated SoxYZ-like carrier [Methylobacterium nodulans]